MIHEIYFFGAGNVAARGARGRLAQEQGDLIDLYLRELIARGALSWETVIHRHDAAPGRITLREYVRRRMREGLPIRWWKREAK